MRHYITRTLIAVSLLFVIANVLFYSIENNDSPVEAYGFNDAASHSDSDGKADVVNSATAEAEAQASVHDPSESIFCEVLNDRITRSECDYFSEILSQLDFGAGGVDVPRSIVRGETTTISFAITRDVNDISVRDALGSEPDERVSLKIGRRMAAELRGDGFDVEPAGLQERDLFVGSATRWDWRVTPLRARNYRLWLSAYVVVQAPDGSRNETLLRTLALPLDVEVTWDQRFGDVLDDSQTWLTRGTNWIKALIAFLLAIGALFAIFKRKRSATSVRHAVPPGR